MMTAACFRIASTVGHLAARVPHLLRHTAVRSGVLGLILGLLVAGAAAALAQPDPLTRYGNPRPRATREYRAGAEVVRLPFEYVNGFIVVSVLLDGALPTKFLFDTGSEHTILTEPHLLSLLGRQRGDSIRIVGSDLSRALTGTLVRRVTVGLNGLDLRSQSLVVLEDEALDLAELTGQPVTGVLGTLAFKAYLIKLDYRDKTITLYRDRERVQLDRYTELPASGARGKLYLDGVVRVHGEHRDSARLLVDTGASLELLTHVSPGDSSVYPPQIVPGTIGLGIGGRLRGFVGRSDSLIVGPLALSELVTYFQSGADRQLSADLPGRGGLVGNHLLDRFVVVLDFAASRVFVRQTRKCRRPRRFDRSGLTLVSDGRDLRSIIVQAVSPGSPAAAAGFRLADRVTHVNGLPVGLVTLEGLRRKLRKRGATRVRLRVARDGSVLRKTIRLRDLI